MLIILSPREVEDIKGAAAVEGSFCGNVLKMILSRMEKRGYDYEIELSRQELRDVEMAKRSWQQGGQRAFSAILRASQRY